MFEVEAGIEQVQVFYRLIIRQVAVTEAGDTVHDGQCITHTALALLRDDVQPCLFCNQVFLGADTTQVRYDIIGLDTFKVKYLAAGQDRWQDLVLLRCG
ncbi:hypothetical protein D3C72_1266520 [compost metagenome]